MPIILNPLKNLKKTLPNLFYEDNITLVPQPDKERHHEKRKLQVNIPNKYRCKNPQ